MQYHIDTQLNDEQRLAERILNHPKFQTMARQKALLGWSFSVIMFLVYTGFILIIGLKPELFATPVSQGGVTTWGIYIGLFIIVFSFVITAVYVVIANGRFEQMTQEVIGEVKENNHE